MVEISLLFPLIQTVRNARAPALPKALSAELLFPVKPAISNMASAQHASGQD